MEVLLCWGRSLLYFAYPPHCAVCEAGIVAADMLCPPCWAEVGAGEFLSPSGTLPLSRLQCWAILLEYCSGPYTQSNLRASRI